MEDMQASMDSYEKRRAARAAGAGINSDSEDDAEGPLRDAPDGGGQAAARNDMPVAVDTAPLPGEGPEAGQSKPKAPRPKLTYGHLTSQAGIPHVFGTFQEAFHKQRKGAGHETADLGRLLDMFERWHLRLFPHCDFDTFIARVAALHGKPGGKVTTGASLKGDMRELRESVIQIALENVQLQDENGNAVVANVDAADAAAAADPAAFASQAAHAHMDRAPAQSDAAAIQAGAAFDGRDSQASPGRGRRFIAGAPAQPAARAVLDDSDDEFDAVAGASAPRPQLAGAQPCDAQAEWDADELMELMGDSAAAAQQAPQEAPQPDEDMDELDGMLA